MLLIGGQHSPSLFISPHAAVLAVSCPKYLVWSRSDIIPFKVTGKHCQLNRIYGGSDNVSMYSQCSKENTITHRKSVQRIDVFLKTETDALVESRASLSGLVHSLAEWVIHQLGVCQKPRTSASLLS